MICALTVRKLKPGTFDDFREAFMRAELESMAAERAAGPGAAAQFFMLRGTADPDEVVCFGLYDGTLEQLRGSKLYEGYDSQLAAIAAFVDSVGTDGMFEVVERATV